MGKPRALAPPPRRGIGQRRPEQRTAPSPPPRWGRAGWGCGCRTHVTKIRDRPQRRQADPETGRRVDGTERRRQELRGEGLQQMRFAVEQIRQRLRIQRPGRKIRQAPPGMGECRAGRQRAACWSFPWRSARAPRARGRKGSGPNSKDSWTRGLGYRRLQHDAGGSVATSGISEVPRQRARNMDS